jgi:hypothetical protein
MYIGMTMSIKMPHTVNPDSSDRKAEAFISGAGAGKAAAPATDARKSKVVNMRFDVALLKRVDAAARKLGISRTAWLHVAASKALE